MDEQARLAKLQKKRQNNGAFTGGGRPPSAAGRRRNRRFVTSNMDESITKSSSLTNATNTTNGPANAEPEIIEVLSNMEPQEEPKVK